ncbi:MAG: cobalamin-dependent protein [Acidimicrobiia bacterium]|nr:cobalamin-dependent protein [Acidimicrobiia bacterium]
MSSEQIASVRLAVTASLIEGDAGGAFHLIQSLLEQGIPFDVVLFDIVAVAYSDFGRRWQAGDYRIGDEHAATGTVENLLALLAGSFDLPDDGEPVVLAAAEGDHHSLPVRLASAHLLSLGYRVRYLGSNMEANDLGAYLLDEPPKALILSCAIPTLLPGARAGIRAAHGAGVPILGGGSGFGPNGIWAYAVGADAWVASPREIDEVLRTWEPDIETAEQMVLPAPPEMAVIERHRHDILAAAIAALDNPDRRLVDELSLLLDAVESTLLVDDPSLLSHFTTWQSSMLSSHGFAEQTPAQLRRALSVRLRELAPAAADLLNQHPFEPPPAAPL